MSALGFANPWMLAWLAAAAIPIAIHLLHRRRHRDVPWAAMRFLLAAAARRSRSVRIHDWLLMVLRVTIVVAAVIAAAQPTWESGASATWTWPAQGHYKILVLDASMSMGFQDPAAARMAAAKQAAQHVLERAAVGDTFSLIVMRRIPEVLIGTPPLDAAQCARRIQEILAGDSRADLEATLAAVEELLANAEDNAAAWPEVYFFTDLAANTWGVTTDRGPAQKAEALARRARLVIVDVGGAVAANASITSARISGLPVVGMPLEWEVTVEASGGIPREAALVELSVDGETVASKAIPWGETSSRVVPLTYRFETAGERLVETRLRTDALAADNTWRDVVHVRDALRVLCVDGRGAARSSESEAAFLQRAIESNGSPSNAPFAVTVIPEDEFAEAEIGKVDCIIFCNVARFSPREAERIEQYLRAGGSVIFFCGDLVDPEAYRRQLFARGQGRPPLLPAEPLEIAPPGTYHLDPLEYRHAILDVFRGQERSGLLSTPVFRYVRLRPPEDSRTLALAFDNGDGALVVSKIHGGQVALVATAASTLSADPETGIPWTLLPAWPSFVPLVHELLKWCIQPQNSSSIVAGEAWSGQLPVASTAGGVIVHVPDGRELAAETAAGGALQFRDTFIAGVYRLHEGTSMRPIGHFTVQADRSESDLARMKPTALPPAWQLLDEKTASDAAAPRTLRAPRGAWHLLLLVVALVVAESLLSRPSGGRGR